MTTYYISGYTYPLKEDIKMLKPTRKDFTNWWKYDYDFECWILEVPNSCNTKKFRTLVENFCSQHQLKLEVYEFTKSLTKSMQDFKTPEAWFDYLHKSNNKNIKFR